MLGFQEECVFDVLAFDAAVFISTINLPILFLLFPLFNQSSVLCTSLALSSLFFPRAFTSFHSVWFCQREGVGDSDLVPVPPTHTLNVTSSDLASGMPWSLSSGPERSPKCHSCPVTLEGSANIIHPSGPFPPSPQ